MKSIAGIPSVTRQMKLRYELRALANWALVRSVQDHDINTTLTMLKRKAEEVRVRVMKGGT